ncbi:MAG: protein kinase domain-containing protein [bacterium]|jgi:serine/threonine-protein kinase|nr:protein kinase [Betaproteobacteria bacterium]
MMLPDRIGKYRIDAVIGRGGMGIVYRGFDLAIERAVAIKSISRAALPIDEQSGTLDRFRREAQAAGRLVHPNIVQIFEYGEDGDIAFIAMELVEGCSLHQELASRRRFTLREIARIMAELLDALAHSHAQGVVHRDIKPANILLNAVGRVKISDFGIARIESSNLTQSGQMFGTPYYMAPEQFLGQHAGPEADLYAAGVIAYELLTSIRPYSGGTPQIMRQVLDLETLPIPPSRLNANVSETLDDVVLTALAKPIEDRFDSAAEFGMLFAQGIVDSLALTGDAASADSPPMAPLPAGIPATGTPSPGRRLAAARRQHTVPPASTFPGDRARNGSRPQSSAHKPRLLVVDDEERILSALKSVFRNDYHVFATSDCEHALAFIARYRMHAIVSDQRMPGMTGVELLRRAKEIAPGSMRILLTGYADLASIVGSINDGEIYRFVSKPWDNNELRSIVREAVAVSIELADLAPPPSSDLRPDRAILVVDSNGELYRSTRELMADVCPVRQATGPEVALGELATGDVGVVLFDIDAGSPPDNANLIKTLKQDHPQLLTLVVTEASDSELMIGLINGAQIFRFINKPVALKNLRGHLIAALVRAQQFEQAPQLVRRQAPELSSAPRLALPGRWLDRIRELGERIGLRRRRP